MAPCDRPVFPPGEVRRLALVQPRVGIGDMIWHLPHIRALTRCAGGQVTLVARPRSRAAQLVGAEDGISDIFWVERDQWIENGRHQGVGGVGRLVSELRAQRFDAAVLLTRSRILAFSMMAAGVPARWGYGVGSQRMFLNRMPFLPQPAGELHPHRQATAWLAEAGVFLDDAEPNMPVSEQARTAARTRLGVWRGPPVALGIAGSDSWKRWSAASFADLARSLLSENWPLLVLVGGLAEQDLVATILRSLGPDSDRVIPVLGWDLQDLAALLAECALYVGNDTAALNIAAAVGTRAYGLFGGTPVLQHSRHIVPVVPPRGPCQITGMANIAVTAVLDVIARDRAPAVP